ncbi:hypothetical protein K8R62_02710 [bacterium]|nr:hypothetical protein [bacterium]
MRIKKEASVASLGKVQLIEFLQEGNCLSCNKSVLTKAWIKTCELGGCCCEDCFLNKRVVKALEKLSLNVSMA